jgi:hypothetical protein
MREQLAIAVDRERGTDIAEKVPEQDLIRCEHRAAKRLLQPVDCSRRPEAVPSDEDCLCVVRHVPRRPFVDGRGVDPIRISREAG